MRFFLIFTSIGILLHFIPSWNIPLHSDVTWFFYLQTLDDPNLIKSIPEGYKQIGAYPNDLISSLIKWYQLTGRFNFFDIATLRLTSQIAWDNANLLRFIYIILMSGAITFFYLIGRKLNISKPILIILSAGLFLFPLDAWTNYKTAEPKAIFFLMLSFYFALRDSSLKNSTISAAFMLLTFLSKETFLAAWLVVPTLLIWKELNTSKKRFKTLIIIKKLIPHLLTGLLLISFFLFMKYNFPMTNSGYINQNYQSSPPIVQYYLKNLPSALPILFSGMWIMLFGFSVVIFYLYKKIFPKFILTKYLKEYLDLKSLILIIFLTLSIFGSIFLYHITGRDLIGRYIIPTNFLTALLFGVFVTKFYNEIITKLLQKKIVILTMLLAIVILYPYRSFFYTYLALLIITFAIFFAVIYHRFINKFSIQIYKRMLLLIIVLILSLPSLDFLLNLSIQEGIDQTTWQNLINEVTTKAPKNASVILAFEEPQMIETAQSLEINTLIKGRTDLRYYLQVSDPTNFSRDNGFTRYLFNAFNKDRTTDNSSKSLIVEADRKRKGPTKPNSEDAFEDVKLLIKNPSYFFQNRYVKLKTPYINYRLILSPEKKLLY